MVAVGRHPPRLALPSQSSWVPLDVTRASVEELVVLIQASRGRPDQLHRTIFWFPRATVGRQYDVR